MTTDAIAKTVGKPDNGKTEKCEGEMKETVCQRGAKRHGRNYFDGNN